MKKPSADYKLQQMIRQKRADFQRERHKDKGGCSGRAEKGVVLAKTLHKVLVVMPEICSFLPEYIEKSLLGIAEIRDAVENGSKVLIDFGSTRQLTANFSVYLFSEISKLTSEYGPGYLKFKISGLAPRVKYLLKEFGLLFYAQGICPSVSNGVLPVMHGAGDDENVHRAIDFVVEEAIFQGQLSPERRAQAESLVSRAISEAVLNVDYHAYPGAEKAYKQWWFTAAIFEDELYLSLCDRGVGIPVTLPRQAWYEQLIGLLPINDDATMIQAAMQYTRTSVKRTSKSKRKGRGLGTKDMQSLVLKSRNGSLVVISRRGYYLLSGADSNEKLHSLNAPLDGTSINWKIPLRETTW